mmetsp:Transcript_3726/g.10332  ORF Transcript_3726/g.10332 Transcript_3726/m.10332 type:complete len:269 (-) Transcript_3726:1106-1912(-)
MRLRWAACEHPKGHRTNNSTHHVSTSCGRNANNFWQLEPERRMCADAAEGDAKANDDRLRRTTGVMPPTLLGESVGASGSTLADGVWAPVASPTEPELPFRNCRCRSCRTPTATVAATTSATATAPPKRRSAGASRTSEAAAGSIGYSSDFCKTARKEFASPPMDMWHGSPSHLLPWGRRFTKCAPPCHWTTPWSPIWALTDASIMRLWGTCRPTNGSPAPVITQITSGAWMARRLQHQHPSQGLAWPPLYANSKPFWMPTLSHHWWF